MGSSASEAAVADPTRIFLRALMRRLPADAVREAMHLAVDALLDD